MCVVCKVVYMGTVNNSNKTWYVLMCACSITINKLEEVFKSPGVSNCSSLSHLNNKLTKTLETGANLFLFKATSYIGLTC